MSTTDFGLLVMIMPTGGSVAEIVHGRENSLYPCPSCEEPALVISINGSCILPASRCEAYPCASPCLPMASNPAINILLSTYNGCRYLAALLDSLLEQTCNNIIINIRDDGSTDRTREILDAYSDLHPSIRVEYGDNLGPARSFHELLKTAHEDDGYFAYCDQDDIWLADKIEAALTLLNADNADGPLLYCSRLEYVDADLKHLGYSPVLKRAPKLHNALVENVAIGCTLMFNHHTRKLLLDAPPPPSVMHDHWCYLLGSAFGRILFDPVPRIKYRQHKSNVYGAAASSYGLIKRRIARFINSAGRAYHPHDTAMLFHEQFGDRLDSQNQGMIERFISSRKSFGNRVRYALHPEVYRQSGLDNFILRCLILANHY